MTVIGADAVERAARDGRPLRVDPADLLTPLARERARDLKVEIVTDTGGSGPTPAPTRWAGQDAGRPAPSPAVKPALVPARAAPRATVIGSDPVRLPAPDPGPGRALLPALGPLLGPVAPFVGPPSGALYRRGAPVTGPREPTGRTGRVVVIGAGHVGMITALRLADADLFTELVLVDVDEGRAAGVALDLTHTAALSGFATRIRGVGSVEAAGPADYVVITAGRARQPGMSRADLISTNAAIVGELSRRVAATSPHAVLLVVTNPLDEMTQHAWATSGFPARRVIGMAGVLDTARFQALAAPTVSATARPDRVSAWALGSHGEEMVVPLSQASLDGRPLAGPEIDAVVTRTRGSGAEVVGLLRTGSAFLAPGTSAARMVLAMARDTGEVMPAAVLADGSYGIRDVYVGLPARLGRDGVAGIVELPLPPAELTALRRAAERIRERLAGLPTLLGTGSIGTAS
jgi:malate dehydrogenase